MTFIRIERLHPQKLTPEGWMTINPQAIDAMFWSENCASPGYTTILLRCGVCYYSPSTVDEILRQIPGEE